MRSTCDVCGEPIVSSLDVTAWYHLPRRRVRGRGVLSQGISTPVQHRATPGVIEHDCIRPDPHCPGDGCGAEAARRWAEERYAELDRADERLPLPGMLGDWIVGTGPGSSRPRGADWPDPAPTKRISMATDVPDELMGSLQARADAQGITVPEWVRRALQIHVDDAQAAAG